MSKRFRVRESYGIAYRNTDNTRWNSAEWRTVSASTVRRYVHEMRQWANGTFDTISDQRYPHCTESGCTLPGHRAVRVVTAHHYVSGVDNVRQLSIEEIEE